MIAALKPDRADEFMAAVNRIAAAFHVAHMVVFLRMEGEDALCSYACGNGHPVDEAAAECILKLAQAAVEKGQDEINRAAEEAAKGGPG